MQQKSWGHALGPLNATCLHTQIFTPLPPYSLKTLFPPLSRFLDEGLLYFTCINVIKSKQCCVDEKLRVCVYIRVGN